MVTMQQIKKKSESQWSDTFHYLYENDNVSHEQLQEFASRFIRQLLEDEQKMNNNEEISDCCIFAPRRRSHIQKKHRLCEYICVNIFDDVKVYVHASIHYHRLIARLTRYYISISK